MLDTTMAAIYARTSPGPKQRDNYSIEEQVQAAWNLCEQRNWVVNRVFVDGTVSGKNLERPKFQEMLQCARQGGVGVIVVWKLDRAFRSLADLVNIQRELQSLGVGLASVTEALDSSSPTGRFNMRSLGSVAELERELISERTKLGLFGLARERRWPNAHPPLGYVIDPQGRLAVDLSEANLVVRIFTEYIELKSMPQLAYNLNAEGVPTNTGARGAWNARAVRDILRNEVYRGVYSVAGVRESVGELRIVSDDLFQRANEIKSRYANEHSDRPPMTLSRREAKADAIHSRFQTFLNQLSAGEKQVV